MVSVLIMFISLIMTCTVEAPRSPLSKVLYQHRTKSQSLPPKICGKNDHDRETFFVFVLGMTISVKEKSFFFHSTKQHSVILTSRPFAWRKTFCFLFTSSSAVATKLMGELMMDQTHSCKMVCLE